MTTMPFPDNVFFKPWVGDNYERGIAGQKVLLVAESCYTWEDENGELQVPNALHVPQMIRWRLDGNEMRFFSNIERTFLVAAPDLASPANFWNSVAMHEFVQRPMASSSHRPMKQDWQQSWEPFQTVVRCLSPDCVFILGFVMWKELQEEKEKETLVLSGDEELWRCGYEFHPGRVTSVYRIRHPSRAYRPDAWAQCVKKALDVESAKVR